MQTEHGRQLYVSTGTMVGHTNGYDYRRALREIRRFEEKELCGGLELMMLKFYYDKIDDVTGAVRDSGCCPATIHCEKDVGTLLSDAGVLSFEGKYSEADEKYAEALRLFRLNCTAAEKLGIERMVLHLWGGYSSDRHIEYNISKMDELNETAGKYGVRILCENIPSGHTDPRHNWHLLLPHLKNAGLIFDTRFGKLHEQIADILTDASLTGKIEHMHISDFAGTYRDFAALRPILHPGEGSVDFFEVSSLLDGFGYTGSITLESPVMIGEDLDIPKLGKTLEFLKKNF